jgi:hypothetical protein
MVQTEHVSSCPVTRCTWDENVSAQMGLTASTEAQVADREGGSKWEAMLGWQASAPGGRFAALLRSSAGMPWSRWRASWPPSSSCVTCTLDSKLTIEPHPHLPRIACLRPTPCKWQKAGFLTFIDRVWTRGGARALELGPRLTQHVGSKPDADINALNCTPPPDPACLSPYDRY